MPDAMRVVMTVVALAFGGVIYVIIPGALVLFYRSPHVKATCEARDPVVRWTDACPLPVLAVSLMLGLGAAWMPVMIVASRSVVPCFGCYLSGAPAAANSHRTARSWQATTWTSPPPAKRLSDGSLRAASSHRSGTAWKAAPLSANAASTPSLTSVGTSCEKAQRQYTM